ncbi:MAG: branched-chain amino acid ABC transporter permease [Hyphomicrobiaceae bacterium]
MHFLIALIIDGCLAGAIYALIALAFVLVYKASRVVNLALGEWVMLGALLVATAMNVGGLGLAESLVAAFGGMIALAWIFDLVALRHLVGRPLIAALMVTLGVGTFIRGTTQIGFAHVPRSILSPFPTDPYLLGEIVIPADRLWAGAIALLVVAGIAWLYRRSRTGVALRAIADDVQAAMAAGIDTSRHVLIAWGSAGVVAAIGGVLWTFVTGGGFGVGLVGLKIFPIVIIGGLDSIAGALVAAVLIGVLESLAAGYLEPYLGAGCSLLVTYLALIAMLLVRPHGLFGEVKVARV